jgi:hypothetical protein
MYQYFIGYKCYIYLLPLAELCVRDRTLVLLVILQCSLFPALGFPHPKVM